MSCSRVRPLFPAESSRTLVHRLCGRVDRLRQRLTRYGLRPYRVFMVWTHWGGAERGEGDEVELAELEVLPTPSVSDLTTLTYQPYAAGVLPIGSVRVDRISARYPEELLVGKVGPAAAATGKDIREPYDFFYEVVPDDRGEHQAPDRGCGGGPSAGFGGAQLVLASTSGTALYRRRFRLFGNPFRRAGQVDWSVVLERASEDRKANRLSNVGVDE